MKKDDYKPSKQTVLSAAILQCLSMIIGDVFYERVFILVSLY